MQQPASGMCYFVRHSSNEIQLVLIPTGKILSFKIVLPCSRVDPLSFCDVSGLTSPHSYINVYFSGVRALYIKQGLNSALCLLRLRLIIGFLITSSRPCAVGPVAPISCTFKHLQTFWPLFLSPCLNTFNCFLLISTNFSTQGSSDLHCGRHE